jgi:hypothetical protein
MLAGLALAATALLALDRPPPTLAGGDPVIVGAGDIASCSSTGDEATELLLDAIAGTVVTFGDNVYETGMPTEFANCYNPSWGQHLARTMPSPGNHDYASGGAGYHNYFGAAAGDPLTGYYSYDLGAWHIIVLNSNCTAVGGCGAGFDQEQWLRGDLAANPADCTLAYWHHPRFSSGPHGSSATYQAFWQALYDYQADVVLVGHDHDYERFALQTPAGVASPLRGIREIVVGTGGRSHYAIGPLAANSEVSNGDTYGVITMTLHPYSYDWEFVPVAGATFTDAGSGQCVGPDQDGDGCMDIREASANPLLGGSRDLLNPYDFFDTPPYDQAVTVNDIGRIVTHFGSTTTQGNYGPEFDRTLLGPDTWNLGPPNGSITIIDISLSVYQFGHSCIVSS